MTELGRRGGQEPISDWEGRFLDQINSSDELTVRTDLDGAPALPLALYINQRWLWTELASLFGLVGILVVASPNDLFGFFLVAIFAILPFYIAARLARAMICVRVDQSGVDVLSLTRKNILWSDIDRLEVVADVSPAALVLGLISAGGGGAFPRDSWFSRNFAMPRLRIYFRKEIWLTGRSKAIGAWTARTYLSIPPMNMPAADLAALLNRLRLAYGTADSSKDTSHV